MVPKPLAVLLLLFFSDNLVSLFCRRGHKKVKFHSLSQLHVIEIFLLVGNLKTSSKEYEKFQLKNSKKIGQLINTVVNIITLRKTV